MSRHNPHPQHRISLRSRIPRGLPVSLQLTFRRKSSVLAEGGGRPHPGSTSHWQGDLEDELRLSGGLLPACSDERVVLGRPEDWGHHVTCRAANQGLPLLPLTCRKHSLYELKSQADLAGPSLVDWEVTHTQVGGSGALATPGADKTHSLQLGLCLANKARREGMLTPFRSRPQGRPQAKVVTPLEQSRICIPEPEHTGHKRTSTHAKASVRSLRPGSPTGSSRAGWKLHFKRNKKFH